MCITEILFLNIWNLLSAVELHLCRLNIIERPATKAKREEENYTYIKEDKINMHVNIIKACIRVKIITASSTIVLYLNCLN